MFGKTAAISLIVCFLLAWFDHAHAGSKYGLNFIGERVDAGDARSVALGGDLQLIPDSLGVLQRNPAMLVYLNQVTVGAAQFISINRGKSSGFSERDISVKYPTLMLGIPLTERMVIGIGYRGRYDPGSSFAYESVSQGGEIHKTIFRKSGSLYAIPLTMALALSKYAAAGFYYSLERGSIEDRWEIHFKEPGFAPGLGLKKVEFAGSGYGGGVVFFPQGPLMIGALFESEINYNVDVSERFTQSAIDTFYRGKVKLPWEVSLAVNWRISPSWMLAGSAGWRDFQKFEGLSFPVSRLYREERYALGIEYARGKQLPLRFSLAFERLPYDFPIGERIEKFSAGLGTGLIFRDGKGKIDIAFQFGETGSADKNGLEDRFFRFYVGVSGGEVWKRHRVDW